MIFERKDEDLPLIVAALKEGKVGILPCDTIYGISALAIKETAERIYEIKRRPANKNFIALLSLDEARSGLYDIPSEIISAWPAPLTAIVNGRDGVTHALRVPKDDYLLKLLPLTGPIWSTSVNFSGEPSLTSFEEIRKTFLPLLDFAVVRSDEKTLSALPSTLIDCTSRPFKLIRAGAYDTSGLI